MTTYFYVPFQTQEGHGPYDPRPAPPRRARRRHGDVKLHGFELSGLGFRGLGFGVWGYVGVFLVCSRDVGFWVKGFGVRVLGFFMFLVAFVVGGSRLSAVQALGCSSLEAGSQHVRALGLMETAFLLTSFVIC